MTKQDVKQMDTEAQDVMPAHRNIAAALAGAQMEMGKAIKSANNPHLKRKYADLGAVMDACLPSLNRHGIAVIQPVAMCETERCVVTKFIHESGEALECPVPLIVGKNDMQGLGSAMTYARRYGLMSLAGIAPEDDDGAAAVIAAPKRQEAPRFDGPAAAKRIRGKLAQATSLDDLKDRWTQEADTIAKIKSESMEGFQQIERAKNDRKAALEKADLSDNADLDGDTIPYEGAGA